MASPRLCSVDGCGKRAEKRGWCEKHYQRWKRHGDPALGAFKPRGACSVPGCDKAHLSRGWCAMHYARWSTKGDANAERVHEHKGLRFIEERAVTYVGDGCLIWPLGKTARGYGAVFVDGRQRGAHVVVCRLVHGSKPTPAHEVAHGCGNRLCCNPKHLRWATRSDNHADKIAHGTSMRGERHHKSKLTEADVREIRSLQGKLSSKEIAKRYGVSSGTVNSVLRKQAWGWLS